MDVRESILSKGEGYSCFVFPVPAGEAAAVLRERSEAPRMISRTVSPSISGGACMCVCRHHALSFLCKGLDASAASGE